MIEKRALNFYITRQNSSDFEVKHIACSMVNINISVLHSPLSLSLSLSHTHTHTHTKWNTISVSLAAMDSPPLSSFDLIDISEQIHSFQTFELYTCITAIPKQTNMNSDVHLCTYPTAKVRCFYCRCPIVYWQSFHSKQRTYRQNFTKGGFQQTTTE